jgi:hypothetical protein
LWDVRAFRKVRQVYGFGTVIVNWCDFCEEEGNEWGTETRGDEAEAEAQLALVSVTVADEGI